MFLVVSKFPTNSLNFKLQRNRIASSLAYKLLFFLYFRGGQSTLIAQFSEQYLLQMGSCIEGRERTILLLKEDPSM